MIKNVQNIHKRRKYQNNNNYKQIKNKTMAIISTIFFYVLPGTIFATYQVLKLGPQLPIASRRMGQRIGLGYQIFKSLMKINLPTDIVKSNEIVKLLRQTDQQANAFDREVRSQIFKMKQEIKEQVPQELKRNPYQINVPKSAVEENIKISNAQGSELLMQIFLERERLIKTRQDKQKQSNFSQNF